LRLCVGLVIRGAYRSEVPSLKSQTRAGQRGIMETKSEKFSSRISIGIGVFEGYYY
jgi:hypothetical protein